MKEKTKSNAIHQIINDNEGSFQSNIFDKFLIDKNIILTMNASNDHHVMGIVDNFAKRLKTILKRTFLLNNSTNCPFYLYSTVSSKTLNYSVLQLGGSVVNRFLIIL